MESTRFDQAEECVKTVFEFFLALDTRIHTKAIDLFTIDGTWERGGATLKGREAIAGALASRPAERTTFHAVCNPVVSGVSPTCAEVHFFLMAYEAQVGVQHLTPLSAVRRCVDRLKFDGERWRIAHKSSVQHIPADER